MTPPCSLLDDHWTGTYTTPSTSPTPYTHHHASIMGIYAHTQSNPDKAYTEIQTLFNAQHDNGFIPGIITWNGTHPSLIQREEAWTTHQHAQYSTQYNYLNISTSPLLVSAIHHWYTNTEQTDTQLKNILPHIDAFLDWWKHERKYKHSSLLYIRHPLEALLPASHLQQEPLQRVTTTPVEPITNTFHDTLPVFDEHDKNKYDALLALFVQAANTPEPDIRDKVEYQVINPLTNSLYVQACKDLASLYEEHGFTDRAGKWSYEAKTVTSSIGVQLWHEDERAFCGHDITAGKWITNSIDWVGTVFAQVPIYPRLNSLLQTINNNRTDSKHGCCINQNNTISPMFNWLILTGLNKYDRTEDSRIIREITTDLCDTGYSQYFTGAGEQTHDYQWAPTMSVCNLL